MTGSEPRLADADENEAEAADVTADEGAEAEGADGGLIQSMSMRMGDEDRIFGAASSSAKFTLRAESTL
jgi:hypothetical protein